MTSKRVSDRTAPFEIDRSPLPFWTRVRERGPSRALKRERSGLRGLGRVGGGVRWFTKPRREVQWSVHAIRAIHDPSHHPPPPL